jgi:two-component system, NarL family, nitrate/nitrite response regulator NarL
MRLILADDHNLFREALCYYLRQCAGDIEILEASDLDGALAAARRGKPDLILLDFVMPGMDGAKGVRRTRQEIPETPVVVLSGNISQQETAEALRSGATSVISKELSGDALRDALGRILAGETIVAAPSWDKRLPNGPAKSGEEPGAVPPFGLTPRELDAVRLLLRGMADKVIAHELGIAAVTVRLHLYHAFRKIGARNRLDAVRIALQAGIAG